MPRKSPRPSGRTLAYFQRWPRATWRPPARQPPCRRGVPPPHSGGPHSLDSQILILAQPDSRCEPRKVNESRFRFEAAGRRARRARRARKEAPQIHEAADHRQGSAEGEPRDVVPVKPARRSWVMERENKARHWHSAPRLTAWAGRPCVRCGRPCNSRLPCSAPRRRASCRSPPEWRRPAWRPDP